MRLLTSPFNLVVNLFSLLLIGTIVIAVATIGLAARGGPSACMPTAGAIITTAFHAEAFQQKWDALELTLDGGSSGSARFNEAEITSRADLYLRENTDVDVANLRICIHDGFAQASGRLKTGVGLDVRLLISGTADFSANPVRSEISLIEAGTLPGFLVDFAGLAGLDGSHALDEVLGGLTVEHTYKLTFSAGQVLVEGIP